MKRSLTLILASTLMLSLTACANSPQQIAPVDTTTSSKSASSASSSAKLNTTDELEAIAIKDADDLVAALTAEYETLTRDIDTYEKYRANADKIDSFYLKIVKDTESLGITLCERAATFAELVLSSSASNDDKYDEMDDIYDYIYEDAAEIIYDDIYDGILDDMYNSFYSGILDHKGDAPYEEWSEARSNEYEWWSGARSDVYSAWSDCRSDVYGLWSDMRSELFSDDIERAQKKLDDFKEDIAKQREKIA